MSQLVVAGAGGHARSILDALTADPSVTVVGCTDPHVPPGFLVGEVEVLGDDGILPMLRESGRADAAAVGVGGVGDNGPRRRLFDTLRALRFDLAPILAPGAHVSCSATLGEGTVVLPGAVVGSGARIGCNVIVNCGAIVEHNCSIGHHCHIASGATVGGNVAVAEGAHVGLGATVRQGISIGTNALVAAGAVVVEDVPDHARVMGIPARRA